MKLEGDFPPFSGKGHNPTAQHLRSREYSCTYIIPKDAIDFVQNITLLAASGATEANKHDL